MESKTKITYWVVQGPLRVTARRQTVPYAYPIPAITGIVNHENSTHRSATIAAAAPGTSLHPMTDCSPSPAPPALPATPFCGASSGTPKSSYFVGQICLG